MKRLPTKNQLDQMKAALSTMNYFCNRKCDTCSINDRMDDEDTCPVTTLEAIVEGIETDVVNWFYSQKQSGVKEEDN